MAFIDGQNLYQHAKDAFGHHHPNYDPIKLHRMVCASKGWTPNLVRFYTGVPSEKESPMWAGYWSNRILAMKRAGIHVTTRPLRYRATKAFDCNGQEQEITVPQEKGIDVRLALDIVTCAIKRQYDVAVIYSQDQDLNEVVADVRDAADAVGRTIEIASAFPSGPNATYHRGINKTEWIRLEQPDYDQCLDLRDYRPKGV
ncbi:NYN domain-containing protein [Novosphingobium rhizosphaerae]|uniref:NYN domain-containing protein n=1 Tax=Novosphingobium rhizosphaerae TaxID=1551649 RepID=UPI0017D93C7A